MSLIPCTDRCVYQKDGYCTLERAASKGKVRGGPDGCAHFIERRK